MCQIDFAAVLDVALLSLPVWACIRHSMRIACTVLHGLQGKIRLPGDAGIDTKDMVMHPAAAAHRVFVDAGGKVNHANFNAMPAGTLFVERAALVEHMYFEAQRLEPER